MTPASLFIDALQAAGITVFDGEPTATPAGPYVAVWDDTGLRRPDNYGGVADSNRITFTAMCVARTPEGLRALVQAVTDTLTGLRLAGRASSPLTEQYAAPTLSGGPRGDVRLTKTLTYTATFPR